MLKRTILVIFRFTRKEVHVLRKCRSERKFGIISPIPHSREDSFAACADDRENTRLLNTFFDKSSSKNRYHLF